MEQRAELSASPAPRRISIEDEACVSVGEVAMGGWANLKWKEVLRTVQSGKRGDGGRTRHVPHSCESHKDFTLFYCNWADSGLRDRNTNI